MHSRSWSSLLIVIAALGGDAAAVCPTATPPGPRHTETADDGR